MTTSERGSMEKRRQLLLYVPARFEPCPTVIGWSLSVEAHTKSLYTLTLKSNRFVIVIAPISPSKLWATSKHSLGPCKGTERPTRRPGVLATSSSGGSRCEQGGWRGSSWRLYG